MSNDCNEWLKYADENLAVAALAVDGHYYNACLQNIQQAVEKYLKAALLFLNAGFPKTHSIETLNYQLVQRNVQTGLSEEDCDLLDSIYVPSKYPVGGVLPDFEPDLQIAKKCLDIGENVKYAIVDFVCK